MHINIHRAELTNKIIVAMVVGPIKTFKMYVGTTAARIVRNEGKNDSLQNFIISNFVNFFKINICIILTPKERKGRIITFIYGGKPSL